MPFRRPLEPFLLEWMTSIKKASVLSELLALSFKGQHRRQVLVAYILFEAPFVELILELFVSIDVLSEDRSSM